MKKYILFALTVVIIISSCAKKADSFREEEVNGVTHYINSDTSADPSASLNLKKLFTISSENQTDTAAYLKRPMSITEDSSGNIFILDIMSMSIKKFDSQGNFVTSIGRSGQGPGELYYPSFAYINNDTLKVFSAPSRKISKFDLDGNFYADQVLELDVQLQNTKVSRDNSKIASYVVKQIQKEGQMPDIDFGLNIVNAEGLLPGASLTSKVLSMQDLMAGKIDINDLIIPFVPGNEHVYVSENSDSQYRIFAYDYEGNKKFEIRKAFKNIRYEKEEKEKYEEEMKKMSQGVQSINVGNFKKAIVSMHTDRYGRLLVVPSVDRNIDPDGVYIDIFKDGKFLNRVDYPIQDKDNIGLLGMFRSQEFFVGDRLYVVKGEDLEIDVYEY
ncbi:MAG: 6-bladed beta-propeller [Candidatus Delongbacteria bacterium]|nr:6-bladed beta-propeller [Candidatus Delongbacteria bacterium]